MLTEKLDEYNFYLVSKSPRRHELLKGMGIDFTYYAAQVEETYPASLPTSEVAEYLSKLKLSVIDFDKFSAKDVFIACDTVVVLGDKVLGKPKNELEAVAMLKELSGKEHVVISGLTVATRDKMLTSRRETTVKFAPLSDEVINHYVKKYRPLDKAGAYGVQEWIGCVGIEYINGSFYNVMGLPTRLLWEMLEDICR
ncbi:MAG: Maf family protein [Bacteroidales bacterium]|nr:Maf family protein [Bacteroidales bacterium]